MFSYDLKIPKDRIAVLIGAKGKTKRRIEQETKTDIVIDSEEGEITVSGEDGVLLYTAQQVVKAIARGFNPKVALRLLKQDYAYELITIRDFHPKQEHQVRLKGRVIGQGGKSRRVIEDLTESNISVYGKTVGIIAPTEMIGLAKRAVEMLLDGSNHSTVFRWLELKRRDLKRQQVLGK